MPRVIHNLKLRGHSAATRNIVEDTIEAATNQLQARTGIQIPDLPNVEFYVNNPVRRYDKPTRLCSECGARIGVTIHSGGDGFEIHWRDTEPLGELVRAIYHALAHVLLYYRRSADRAQWSTSVRTAEDRGVRDQITVQATQYPVLRAI